MCAAVRPIVIEKKGKKLENQNDSGIVIGSLDQSYQQSSTLSIKPIQTSLVIR